MCRDVTMQLRVRADGKALRGKGMSGPQPLHVREYALDAGVLVEKHGPLPESDLWVVDLAYIVMADPLDATLSANQRVALALELVDRGQASSPQPFVQGLPLAATMNRLRVETSVPVRVPT